MKENEINTDKISKDSAKSKKIDENLDVQSPRNNTTTSTTLSNDDSLVAADYSRSPEHRELSFAEVVSSSSAPVASQRKKTSTRKGDYSHLSVFQDNIASPLGEELSYERLDSTDVQPSNILNQPVPADWEIVEGEYRRLKSSYLNHIFHFVLLYFPLYFSKETHSFIFSYDHNNSFSFLVHNILIF